MSAEHVAHAIHHGPNDPATWRLLVILADHTNPTNDTAQIWNRTRLSNDQAVAAIRRLEDGGWIDNPRIGTDGIATVVTLDT